MAGTFDSARTLLGAAQLLAIVAAASVAIFQLRVRLISGAASMRPPRARWGSVLVAATATLVVIGLGFSQLPIVLLIRSDPSDLRVEIASIAPSDYGRAVKIGRVSAPSLTEASGLAASVVNPGFLWAHNDSGHAPLLYCLKPTGASCGVWDVTGAESRDWEDLAVGPGPSVGASYLYVGDIGDNAMALSSVTVYRVPEPTVDRSAQPSPATAPMGTRAAESIELRYPDGPHDAEVLLIHPKTGDLYIVTKELVSGVYRASAPLDESGVTMLERVARFSIPATLADRTGGAISANGRRVALATYGGAFELTLPAAAASFDAIWSQTPASIAVHGSMQLEAITYRNDERAVFLLPEGIHSPIYRAKRDLR
jgi:hypothetical protein